MTGVCRYCGSRLLPGAVCCSKCGRDVAAPAENSTATRFCGVCGKKLLDGAVFCSGCGATVGNVRSSAEVPANRPKKHGKPCTMRALAAVLAVVITAEGTLFGLNYKSWFGKDNKGVSTVSDTVESSGSSGAVIKQTDVETDIPDIYISSNIPFRYTEEDIHNAPEVKAAVSWEDDKTAVGDTKIGLQSWSLENDDDEIILKDLPVLSAGEDGWSMKGYDYSLASGQSEFATDISITIPREEGECCAKCVYFNEDADSWEDVYFEISDDESSYVIYTDHFSKYAKMYRFDPQRIVCSIRSISTSTECGICIRRSPQMILLSICSQSMSPMRIIT